MNIEKIRVLFLDQREIFRHSIFSIFKDDPEIEMIVQFDRIANWPQLVEKCQSTIVIVDVGYTGTAIINKIKQKNTEQIILAFSDIPKEAEFLNVFQTGVKAYLKTGDLTVDGLRAAIKFATKDILLLSRQFSEILKKYLKIEDVNIYTDQLTRLSDQEKAIVALIMLGISNRDIAKFLHITENTTKVHLRNIMRKLGVKGKQKLAFFVRTHHHLRNELLIDYNYVRDKLIKVNEI